MPPLNWNELQSLDLEKLEDDAADEWIQELQTVKVEKETELGRLHSLFNLARTLLNIKALQADMAIEEGEKMMRTQTDGSTEETKLLQEIEELKEQLSTLRRQAGGKDANSLLREEIRDLEEEKHRLTRELLENKEELRHEQEKSAKLAQRVDTSEKDVRELRKERDHLLEDIRDYQRQLERHRETLSERRVEGEDIQKRMRNRNADMLKLVDEANNFAEANAALRKEVAELTSNLEESTKQMEKTTDQYVRIKEALEEADELCEALRNENLDLQRQLADLGIRGKSQPSIDDELVAAIEEKIEEWKKLFRDKEKETQSYKKQLEEAQQELVQHRVDSDKQSVTALTKALEARNQQIKLLEDRLTAATRDIESNADMLESMRQQLNTGGSTTETQKRRLQLFQKELKNKELRLTEIEKKAQAAETAAVDKDREMAELIARMRQYESGEYGLAEAVDDIRELKVQLDLRNKQTVELTQYCNKMELKTNELLDENDELRRRLGLERHSALDIEVKNARKIERESDKALNVLLQKEIERLEEERLELKMQMRKLAQKLGERAVALGLSADDFMIVERFVEGLKDKRSGLAVPDGSSGPLTEARVGSPNTHAMLEGSARENRSLKAKLTRLESENSKLVQGLQEIRNQIREQTGPGDRILHAPTLDKLITLIETRELTGNVDAALQIKSQVDYMTGRNDELRAELRQLTLDLQKAQTELQTYRNKTSKLESELQIWKDTGASRAFLQPLRFVENLPPNSSVVITNLNEYLIHTLQELLTKEDQLKKMEEAVEVYQRKIAVLKHQQSLLYKEYFEEKTSWTSEKRALEKRVHDGELSQVEAKTSLEELQRLTDTLQQSDDEVKRCMGEVFRKHALARINEKIILRKFAIQQEYETELRTEKEKMERDLSEAETALVQKLGYLERHRDATTYKLSELQKALDNSVPKSDYESLMRKNSELTEKYRRLLEQESEFVKKMKVQDNVQVELHQLQRENEYLKSQMLTEKERSIKLELLAEAGRLYEVNLPSSSDGTSSDSGLSSADMRSVSQRLSVLEMKELNERQKATHAQMMYEEQREMLRRVEARNTELEQKITELTASNLALQKTESSLRDEISNCVTREVHEENRKRILQLEKLESDLKLELNRMKEIEEVAQNQFRYLEKTKTTQNIELNELRRTVIDMQAKSDTNSAIGKLHREIVRMKLADSTTSADLSAAKTKLATLQLQLIRAGQKRDVKEQDLNRVRAENLFRIQQMRRTINSLRQRFAGCVPLESQEKLHKSLISLQSDRDRLQNAMTQAIERENEANDLVEKLKLRQSSLEELIGTLTTGDGPKRIVEWHKKLEELRLSELYLKRQLARTQEQTNAQTSVIGSLEETVTRLEEENVKLTKQWEERELVWESRENELELKILRFETQERQHDKDILEVETGLAGYPDMNLPLAEQLEFALTSLRKRVSSERVARDEINKLKQELDALRGANRKFEAELLRKQRLLLDLRQLIPKSTVAAVDEALLADWPLISTKDNSKEESRSQQHQSTLDLLKATIEMQKARLEQKDNDLEKYGQLLLSSEKQMNEKLQEHFQENEKLRNQVRQSIQRLSVQQPTGALLNEEPKPDLEKLLVRIAELESRIHEQESTIGSLLEKRRSGEAVTEHPSESLAEKLQKLEEENMMLQAALRARPDRSPLADDLRQSVDFREKPSTPLPLPTLVVQKEPMFDRSVSAMTVAWKNVVTQTDEQPEDPVRKVSVAEKPAENYLKIKVRLDHCNSKLKEKEKENKALKQALAGLRDEFTNQATKLNQSSDIGLRELELKELRIKTEERETRLLKQSRGLRSERERCSELETELEHAKNECDRKDSMVTKLRAEKEKLEKDLENTENRLSHLKGSMKQKLQETENRELKHKLTLLEGQLRTMRGQPAEKPLETTTATESRPVDVVKWEESKRYQMNLEKLKTKVETKSRVIEEQDKLIVRLRDRILRLEQEKVSKVGRNTADKQTTIVTVKPLGSDSLDQSLMTWHLERQSLLDQVKDLRLRLDDTTMKSDFFERELRELRDQQQITVQSQKQMNDSNASAITEHEIGTNGRTIEETEKVVQMLRRLLDQTVAERDRWKKDRDALQVILDEEREDNDRLQTRIRDLQHVLQLQNEENDALKQELEELPRETNIETINRLHNTIFQLEKDNRDLQRELEEVKLSSARISDPELQKLVKENKQLKIKLSKAAPRVAWAEQLTEHSRDQTSGSGNLAKENGRLKIDIRKLEKENDQLYRDNHALKAEIEKLDDERRRLQGLTSQSRRWQPSDDPRQRIGEDKQQKQLSRITELEDLLKLEIEKYHRQLFENRRLKDKLHALEWTASKGSNAEEDILYQLRMTKAELATSKSDSEILKLELEALNRQLKPAFNANQQLDVDRWKERMKMYDRVLRENIDLKLECNSLKTRLRDGGDASIGVPVGADRLRQAS